MGTINQDWYAGNATRAYPLDDAATARDDAGLELPSQILVDCRVRFPSTLGRFAYVGGVTVGPGIVTATLMASPAAARPPVGAPPGGAGFVPIGAVSLPRPVQPNRHYPIQPLADGVGGWLVFGRGIDEPYAGRFSSPAQSLLLPRVASAYSPLPIPSLGKLGLAQSLTGVVQLLAGTDLEVVRDAREIDGGIVDAIVIRLVDNLNRNVFSFYAGPCGGRPESRTCPGPALESINAVQPDCDGNLTIDFRGVQVLEFAGGGGLALDLALGMADTCLSQDYLPDETGRLPGEYENMCPPPPVPIVPPTVPPGVPPWTEPPGCIPLPYYESFDAGFDAGPPHSWVICSGEFAVEADDSPGEPHGLEAPGGSAPPPGHVAGATGLPPLHRAAATTASTSVVPVDKSYTATSLSQRNAVIWDCDYDCSTTDLTCTTHLKVMPGTKANGGIIFNYVRSDPTAGNRPTYNMMVVNMLTMGMEYYYYNGQYLIALPMGIWDQNNTANLPILPFPVGHPPRTGDWYELKFSTHVQDGLLWTLEFWFSGVTNPAFPAMHHAAVVNGLKLCAPGTGGKFGLGTYNAHCRFSFFNLAPVAYGPIAQGAP